MVEAYARLVRAQIRSQTQYRASFCVDLVMAAFTTLIEAAVVLVLFRVTPTIGGFDLREVLLMSALASCSFDLADLLVGNIERLSRYVRTGLLDTILVRPLGALPQLLCTDFSLRRIGRVAQSALLLVVVLWYVDIEWTPGRALLLVVTPIAGCALFAATFVLGASVAFWFVESGEIANAFTYGGKEFARYPATIYPVALRRVFGYGLGLALVGYHPALVLTGRADPLGGPSWLAWLVPIAALGAWALALFVWRTGIRHYRSTGS
ncbi:ABC-2 family transporter protein [Streptomyces sp. SID3343]|uniref:ABC-2 family transporter protein n=1 Tax=Streptomyces sp. SID3343 TaxID=2690260 RepID=UPI00136DF190|nr:ABC transporter permease [Streptomyces sp. SID3343]